MARVCARRPLVFYSHYSPQSLCFCRRFLHAYSSLNIDDATTPKRKDASRKSTHAADHSESRPTEASEPALSTSEVQQGAEDGKSVLRRLAKVQHQRRSENSRPADSPLRYSTVTFNEREKLAHAGIKRFGRRRPFNEIERQRPSSGSGIPFVLDELPASTKVRRIRGRVVNDGWTSPSPEDLEDRALEAVGAIESQVDDKKILDDAYATRVARKLSSASTDTDVHEILVLEIFSKMEALNARLAVAEAEALQQRPKRKRRRKQSPTGALKLGKDQGPSPRALIPNEPTLVDPSNPSAGDTSELLHVLQRTYAPLLLRAARELRHRFPRSPYLLNLLPAIKDLGPISYVLGASTPLYNELLAILWVRYRDVQACADLVNEMLARGVSVDRITMGIFRQANLQRRHERRAWGQSSSQSAADKVQRTASNDSQTPATTELPAVKPNASAGSKASSGRDKATAGISHEDVLLDPARPTSRESAFALPEATPIMAGWWLLQGTKSGWERWKEAQAEALERVSIHLSSRIANDPASNLPSAEDIDDLSEMTAAGEEDEDADVGSLLVRNVDAALLRSDLAET